MNNRLKSMLQLSKKAGKLSLGYDMVISCLNKKISYLIITTSDISLNTLKNVEHETQKFKVEIINSALSMDDIFEALGKTAGIISINDAGFAKKIKELLYI